MLDRAGSSAYRRETRKPGRGGCRPRVETLEGRLVLDASLATLPNISVPTYQGYQVPLDGSASNTTQQTYTVTSSNPDIKATVAQGEFLTLNVSHQAAAGNPNDITFSGPITFQLFDDLTPLTTSRIEEFVNSGFYTNKNFHRVAPGFQGPTDFIIQGGSASGDGMGSSGLPGTPFNDEFVQQLAFTGTGQLAMANSGPNTNDTQFFITDGSDPPDHLDYKHTIFGQVVAGMNIVNQMTQVARNGTTPVSRINIDSATLSDTNPNGVIHVDTTQAVPGEISTVTVTATDPSTNTTATQTFQVTVTQNDHASSLPLNLRPIAFSDTEAYTVNTDKTIQLAGDPANSGTQSNQTLRFAITTQPTQGTIVNFNENTGTLTYRPNQNSQANDSFQFTVTNSGAQLTSNPATVTLTTTPAPSPTASPVTQTVNFGSATTIQLVGSNQNPGSNQGIQFRLVTQPTQGSISNFDETNGTLTYTPSSGAFGTDTFQYDVVNVGPPAPGLSSAPATVTIELANVPVNTGAVRQINDILIVSPRPGAPNGDNSVVISQTTDAADPSQDRILVTVGGLVDVFQPLSADISRIVVYGAKVGNDITVDPSVDPLIGVSIDGGRGRSRKVIQAGDGPTRMHGWFGRNTLRGGGNLNQMVGRSGNVKFRPTETTDVIFAGIPNDYERVGRRTPPGGTFFKQVRGKLVPVPTPSLRANFQDNRRPQA